MNAHATLDARRRDKDEGESRGVDTIFGTCQSDQSGLISRRKVIALC